MPHIRGGETYRRARKKATEAAFVEGKEWRLCHFLLLGSLVLRGFLLLDRFCRFGLGFAHGGHYEDDVAVLGTVLADPLVGTDEAAELDELALLQKLEGACTEALAPALAVDECGLALGGLSVHLLAGDAEREACHCGIGELADLCIDGDEATEVETVGVSCSCHNLKVLKSETLI